MSKVETIMTAQGYEAHSTGGGCWTWMRQTDDGSMLWICTYDNALCGDPDTAEWYVGRHSDINGGFVQCEDFLTLAEALAIAPRVASPKGQDGEVQVTLPRSEFLAA